LGKKCENNRKTTANTWKTVGTGGKTGNDLGKMWERSGKEPGMIWEYLEQVGTSMGMAGEKLKPFVTQTATRFKCFDMGLHVIF
jgi:hypothetical protein